MSKPAVLSVPIDSVKPDPNNARRHPERNLAAIAASLARFGQQRPILVDKDGVIVAGNGLWTAMKAAGAESVLIARTELTGAERVAYAIADNRTAELSEWDAEILAQQLDVLGDEFKEAMLFDDDGGSTSTATPPAPAFDVSNLPDIGGAGETGLSFVLMLPFKSSERMNAAMKLLNDDGRTLPEGSRYATIDGEVLLAKLSTAGGESE